MNKLNLWGFLLMVLCTMHQSDAQEAERSSVMSCDEKAALVLQSKNNFKNYSEALIEEMIQYLAPCVEEQDMAATYATGLLTLQTNGNQLNKERKVIELLTKAADANYKPAILKLATLYLTGSFYKLRYSGIYTKALALFEKMIALNYETDIANYGIGYIRMRGVIHSNRKGRYNVARGYLNKSNHPMAKHWLAVMDYYGYGGTLNLQEQALQALADNNITNSKQLRADLLQQTTDWIPISQQEDSFFRNGATGISVTKDKLDKQTFYGKFVEYDWEWKRNQVRRYQPFTIKFDFIDNYRLTCDFTVNGKTYTGHGRIGAGSINFYNFVFPLHKLYPDHPDNQTLNFRIEKVSLKETEVNGKKVIVISKPLAWIVDQGWQERVYNIGMLWYKDAATPLRSLASNIDRNPKELSNNLDTDMNWARIAPNPIGDEFTITYTLDQETQVSLAVFDFYGQQKVKTPMHQSKAGTTQTITVNSAMLTSGTYVVQMTINGASYSKTIIKE